jgi:hypothetical protein
MPVSRKRSISSKSGSTTSTTSTSIKKANTMCQYDPFCFRTNIDHIKQYQHSNSGYNRIILNDEMREQLIDLILDERAYNKTFTLNAVLKLTDKYINEVKRKKKADINAIYFLHSRLQEEATPNQRQLSKISDLL